MQRYKKIARDCAGDDIEYLSDMTVTTVPDPCAVQKVEICPSTPVAPVPVDVLNCDNTTTTLNTEAGDAKRVVISGVEGPIKVCLDDPRDVAATQKCDVNTGNTILIRSVFNDETNLWEVPTYFDLVTGADWTGNPATDLIECSDIDVESDALVGCDNGLPVTQWVVKSNGEPTGVVYYTDATGAIVTPVAWTPGACAAAQVLAQVPNCAGTLDDKPVDSIVGAYLLNQENKHTEVVYDVLTAVFGGSATFAYTVPFNVAISYAGVTLANDTILQYWTDFGDGYNDVGGSPDHSYNSDGAYEIKGYAITVSGNKVLLFAKETTILNGVVTYSGVQGSQVVARTYTRLVASAFQDYCGSVLVGAPYNADGTAYTLVGDFVASSPIVIDELEDNADFNAEAPVQSITMLSGGYSIADGTWAPTLGPDGTSWTNPGNLRSVTIRARKGTNTDANVTGVDQVVIITSLNKYVLFPEDGAVTYSVEDGNIQDIVEVNASGNAAALVIVNTL